MNTAPRAHVLRLTALALAAALALPSPACDRGGQDLAAGNGVACSSHSQALREQQTESEAGLEDIRLALTPPAVPAAGLEERKPRSWKRLIAGTAMVFALGWMGMTLRDRLIDSQQYQLKEGSLAAAIDEYSQRIAAQGGDRSASLFMVMGGIPPLDPESFLDITPKQIKIVRSLSPLQFGPGILYHGRSGLDQAISEGELKGEMFFTRVGYQWATGAFDGKSEDPAIFLMPTGTFNRYLRQGSAILRIEGDRKTELIVDPYPEIRVAVPLSDFSEIWVAEDTFERYQKTTDGKTRALLAQGKIKAVPGLKANLSSEDDVGRREADPFDRIGRYVLQRNLLKEIPAFEKFSSKAGSGGLEEVKRTSVGTQKKFEAAEISDYGARDGALDIGQSPRSGGPSRIPIGQSEDPATSYAPPFSGAEKIANPTQPTIVNANNPFAAAGNFQNRSPATAPANSILPKSARVLDATERWPSVNSGLSIRENIQQNLHNVNSAAELEEVRAAAKELLADRRVREQLDQGGWALLTPRLEAAGHSRRAMIVSDSARVGGGHVVVAPASLRNPRAERMFPWVSVAASDAGEVIRAAKGAGARAGDLILLDAASGLEEGQIRQLLAAGGLEEVRVVVGTPAQVEALPPAAFQLFADAGKDLPPVIILDVAAGLEEQADQTHTLLLMK